MTSFQESNFTATTMYLNDTAGNPSRPSMQHGPQVSQIQFNVSLVWLPLSLLIMFPVHDGEY